MDPHEAAEKLGAEQNKRMKVLHDTGQLFYTV